MRDRSDRWDVGHNDESMTAPHLVVVGAGPAGISAAIEANRHGARVTLIDENSSIGGQYFRGRRHSTAAGSPREFHRLSTGVTLLRRAAVIDATDAALVVAGAGSGTRRISYDGLVVATGAYDRPVALPGWTLPGVVTGGGAHTLAKAFGVVPGKRVVISGSGPFLPQLATALAHCGSQVVVYEATSFSTALRTLAWLSADFTVLRQAMRELAGLAAAGVRIHYERIVTSIEGSDRVEGAVVHRVDEAWIPVSTGTSVAADSVCLAFGFVPNLDLAHLLGCEILYEPLLSAYRVNTDAEMRTTRKRVYAAGETVGIGGARLAASTGAVAGLTFARDVGLVADSEYRERSKKLEQHVGRLRRLAGRLNYSYRPRDGLWSLAHPDTVICRCEEVNMREADQALEFNSKTPAALKAATRVGMGPCQGKICTPYLTEWLRARHGYRVPVAGWPWSGRPPIRPTRVADLLA